MYLDSALLTIVHVYKLYLLTLQLLVGRQEGRPACKKTEWWGAGVVICLERGADLHMAQLMPLPLTVSCFTEIQIGFTFLVPAHLGSSRKRAVKRVCVYSAVGFLDSFFSVKCCKIGQIWTLDIEKNILKWSRMDSLSNELHNWSYISNYFEVHSSLVK